MEGGNGTSAASGITQFANGEKNAAKRATSNDAAQTAPWMDSALGVLLDGFAVKEKRKPPKTLKNAETPSAPLVRGRLRPPKKSRENHR